MTPVSACTVITRNRVAHARVLARSFLKHNPEGRITALLLDDPERAVTGEPFAIVRPEELELDAREFARMAYMYSGHELACALKPLVLARLIQAGADGVVYLDSDMRVFASLEEACRLAASHSLLLTPHWTQPPPSSARTEGEITRLVDGAFNAGFVAVGPGARAFLDWWRERLSRHCLVAPEDGYYGDQRWLDLAPGYFEHLVLNDVGYNVAPWNTVSRTIERVNGGYRVDGSPLRVFHFSGFDAEAPYLLSRWLLPSPHTLLSEQPALAEICALYARELLAEGSRETAGLPYGFERLPDGTAIDAPMRRQYRTALLKADRHGAAEPANPLFAHV